MSIKFNKRATRSSEPERLTRWVARENRDKFVTRGEFIFLSEFQLDAFRDRYFLRYRLLRWFKSQWRQLKRETRELGDIVSGNTNAPES